eukprot:TRINITY_DN6045_c0_g1_i2.p1 TRINITY_DN6045_c0_g1~~TRINITY_DN6045_c0_g1_i2.p1  ORF type:complete len:457 (-),score=114.24 TRINITY_DN6045_c0_g1_i2:75-1445(-)
MRLCGRALCCCHCRSAFEYLQDYMAVDGLRLWLVEFARIVNFSVDMDANAFVKRRLQPWESMHQSAAVPIPTSRHPDPTCHTFMAALMRELLGQTAPSRGVYLVQQHGWFDMQSRREIVGIRTFVLLRLAVGTPGLQGIDRLLGFMCARCIQDGVVNIIRSRILPPLKETFDAIHQKLTPLDGFPPEAAGIFGGVLQGRLFATPQSRAPWYKMLSNIVTIGTIQLLRRHVASELVFASLLDAHPLTAALGPLNLAVLADLRRKYAEVPPPAKVERLAAELSPLLDCFGQAGGFLKVYATTSAVPHAALVLFMCVLLALPRLAVDGQLSALVGIRTKESSSKGEVFPLIDGFPLVVGVATVLQQFHTTHRHCFVSLLAQFIRVTADTSGVKEADQAPAAKDARRRFEFGNLPPHTVCAMFFLQAYARVAGLSLMDMTDHTPPVLLSRFPQFNAPAKK